MKCSTAIALAAAAVIATGCIADVYEVEMVEIPGGTFMMGSGAPEADPDEGPVREVLVDSFRLGRYEVTQELWNSVMDDRNPSCFVGGERPVECVSWDDAQLFIMRLNRLTGRRYRLPTEAEWEYAARAGGGAPTAWTAETSGAETHAVGALPPDGLGLYDMTGNVHEWCADPYDSLAYSRPGGVPVPDGEASMAFRGGSWASDSRHCRPENRNHAPADTRNWTVGFRLAEDAEWKLSAAGTE